jgi:hypothetical protein
VHDLDFLHLVTRCTRGWEQVFKQVHVKSAWRGPLQKQNAAKGAEAVTPVTKTHLAFLRCADAELPGGMFDILVQAHHLLADVSTKLSDAGKASAGLPAQTDAGKESDGFVPTAGYVQHNIDR